MQAKIISRIRTNTTEEHATDPEQTGIERKLILRILLEDMPAIPPIRYYRGPSTGWVPDKVTLTEVLSTGYGDDTTSHYRIVAASGFLLRKDGTVGKMAMDDDWRTYSRKGSLENMPSPLHEALAQVVPAFQKGILL